MQLGEFVGASLFLQSHEELEVFRGDGFEGVDSSILPILHDVVLDDI